MIRWWTREGIKREDATDLLDDLVDRSLLRVDEQQAYSVHAVQRDFLVSHVTDEARLHSRWLAAFAPLKSRAWTDAEDDGYLFDHLAHHMAGAGEAAELRALICPAWRQARARHEGFVHAGFLSDVEYAERFESARPEPDLEQMVRLRMVRECTLSYP